MVELYLVMSLELIHILLMGTILYFKVKKFLKEKNILDFAILWVLTLAAVLVGYNAYLNVNFVLGNTANVYLGQWELSGLIGMLSTAPYFWFLLNLVDAKKIYTLPFVTALYIAVYGFFHSAPLFDEIYVAATFIPINICDKTKTWVIGLDRIIRCNVSVHRYVRKSKYDCPILFTRICTDDSTDFGSYWLVG
jgi:hypothetical protein